jgi:3-methyladenine DNA glycosylase AlkC
MAAPLKDLFNKALIVNIALEISKHYPKFHSHNFISSVLDCDWESLKLKERIKHIAVHLKIFLPSSYSQSINVLKKTAPNFTGFEYLMFADYVELYGLKNFKKSFEALECFTQCSTGEFAIRKFILHNKLKTMRQLKKWSTSDNEHIRRLASEGCRPRLPWGVSLVDFKKDPDLVLEILEILKKDSSKYVQKSVANNLNDISKDNPNKVLQLYSKWDISNPITRWILKHGSRSLLKKGNPKALIFFLVIIVLITYL